MNVEIGAEAALFPEKEYISGIFVAVQLTAARYLISIADAVVHMEISTLSLLLLLTCGIL
jgi:hypothetical protein